MSCVEIDFSNLGRGGRVVVDGKEVRGVVSVSTSMTVGDVPTVLVEVLATNGYLRIDEAETEIRAHIACREWK